MKSVESKIESRQPRMGLAFFIPCNPRFSIGAIHIVPLRGMEYFPKGGKVL